MRLCALLVARLLCRAMLSGLRRSTRCNGVFACGFSRSCRAKSRHTSASGYCGVCLDYVRHERTKEGSLMSLRSRASRPRLLVTRRLPAAVEDHFRARYDVELNPADTPLDAAALRAAMTRFAAICPTITDRFDAAVLDAPGATVTILANNGAGLENRSA